MIEDQTMCDIILQSLPPSYSSFVLNHIMNNIEVSPTELHNMLKTAEPTIKDKTPNVLMVQRKGMKRKGQPKPKEKKAFLLSLRHQLSKRSLKRASASTVVRRGIGRGTVRSTSRNTRKGGLVRPKRPQVFT